MLWHNCWDDCISHIRWCGAAIDIACCRFYLGYETNVLAADLKTCRFVFLRSWTELFLSLASRENARPGSVVNLLQMLSYLVFYFHLSSPDTIITVTYTQVENLLMYNLKASSTRRYTAQSCSSSSTWTCPVDKDSLIGTFSCED